MLIITIKVWFTSMTCYYYLFVTKVLNN
jgi:hypothetical protein